MALYTFPPHKYSGTCYEQPPLWHKKSLSIQVTARRKFLFIQSSILGNAQVASHRRSTAQIYTKKYITDRPRRSVLRCSVFFYIRLGFDGNRSAQCIFASMFCHSDVHLRHQISGTKGLNQCIKCPVVLLRCPPPSSNLGHERVESSKT